MMRRPLPTTRLPQDWLSARGLTSAEVEEQRRRHVHCASCVLPTHGAVTTDPTVSEALAVFVVSVAPTKRCWDVLW